MKGLVKTAAVSLAAAGISSAVAASDRTIEGTAEVPQINGGTGLSFEDLRVGPVGKGCQCGWPEIIAHHRHHHPINQLTLAVEPENRRLPGPYADYRSRWEFEVQSLCL